MTLSRKLHAGHAATLLALAGMAGGCAGRGMAQKPMPIGYSMDPHFRQQEANAEASDFVLYEHEFQGNSARLNDAGEDHLKQIAARVEKTPFPIVIAQSRITPREDTVHKYPIHANEELDLRRREVIVQALGAMGVIDAEKRVVVGRALTFPYTDQEAERAYVFGIMGWRMGGGGFGGGGGGFGGGGGGGGGFF